MNKVEEAVGRFSVSCKFTSASDQFVLAFTGVYGSNLRRGRRFLWEELCGLNSGGVFHGVWVVTLMW